MVSGRACAGNDQAADPGGVGRRRGSFYLNVSVNRICCTRTNRGVIGGRFSTGRTLNNGTERNRMTRAPCKEGAWTHGTPKRRVSPSR